MKSEKVQGPYVRMVFTTPQYDAFYNSLSPKTRIKFDYVVNVISTVYNISTKFIKHLEKTELYEMRVSVGTNEYRTVLFAIDHRNVIEAKNIILLNGFLKKDNRDYRKQIETAMSILNQWNMIKIDPAKLSTLTNATAMLDEKYGVDGTVAREKFNEESLSWFYGNMLRERRKELKLTQKQVAEQLGREQSYIARVENGKADIQLSSFMRIAALLGIQFVPTFVH